MRYIYLDWNVIQYMKHNTINDKKSINGKEFKEILKKISKKYIFPYSLGHLQDLLVSFNHNNIEHIEKDLIFLKEISDNYVLVLNNENIVPLKDSKDIRDLFYELKSKNEIQNKEQLCIKLETNYKVKIDMKKLDYNNLFKPFLEKNNGVLDNNVFEKFLLNMYDNIDNPEYYKRLRLLVGSLKKDFENTPNSVIDQTSNYFKELIPFLNFIIEDDINKMKLCFEDTIISFLNINKKINFLDCPLIDKITLAYSLLDYNIHFRDKINKKNRPSNMFRDRTNLCFASQAKYYVTEDEMTYKKSKFICEVLDLKLKVLKMNEFVKKFL